MARGQEIRNADKAILDTGRWQVGGMQNTAFPLSKRRGRVYRLGSAYRWRVIRFEAMVGTGKITCRLLIAYNAGKEQFRATLAVENDRDMSVIASYEFHGTHPGWHVHAAHGNVDTIPAGSMRGSWQRRKPAPRNFHRRTEFEITSDESALAAAADFFLLYKKEGLLKI